MGFLRAAAAVKSVSAGTGRGAPKAVYRRGAAGAEPDGTDRYSLNLSIAMKKVLLSNGEQLSYNILLIATGGRARLPSQAWASHPQVYTLRHWQDAQRLKSRLMESHKLAIIGGGWIGLEIAASARKSGVAVTLFEQQPALCMRSVSGEVSQRTEAIHREQGWRSVPAAARWSLRTITACRSSTATASVKPLIRSWSGSASISIWSWRLMRG